MHLDSSVWVFVGLCAVAGAVHVLAPDHWVPASILSWKRGWRLPHVMAFSSLAFIGHILLGFGLFFVVRNLILDLPLATLILFSLVFVALVAAIRGVRFSRIREVLRGSRGSVWGIFTVFSLLGPCESIIPIFLKADHLGTGYLLPFSAFFLGTLVAGLALILSGRMMWNRPLWLPRAMNWADRRVTVVPVLAGVVIGLTFLLQISG